MLLFESLARSARHKIIQIHNHGAAIMVNTLAVYVCVAISAPFAAMFVGLLMFRFSQSLVELFRPRQRPLQ